MPSFRIVLFRFSVFKFRLLKWLLFVRNYFVFSCRVVVFVISSFRLASFRLLAWRYFVFSCRVVFSLFRYFPVKRRIEEMAKTSHPSMVHTYRNQELKLFSILLALNQAGIKLYSHITLSASIAQWLEPRPSDLVVVASSPGWGGHICACHIVSQNLLANKGYARHGTRVSIFILLMLSCWIS